MRNITALLISPILAVTGFRFSKLYRLEASRFHTFIYSITSTVNANHYANKLRKEA